MDTIDYRPDVMLNIGVEVQEFASTYGVSLDDVPDVFALAKAVVGRSHLRVLNRDGFRPGADGRVEMDQTIYVAHDLSLEERRHVVAHELGHIALSHLGLRSATADADAEAFALCLLMPEKVLDYAIDELGFDPEALSIAFGLNVALVKQRLWMDVTTKLGMRRRVPHIDHHRQTTSAENKFAKISAGGGNS